jgi:hypothetical protein
MIQMPYDLLTDFPGWNTEFAPLWRQEQSRTASGRTTVKDLGSPLWQATWQSKTMSANALDAWRARLEVLENGAQSFVASPMSRLYPLAYPNGSWPQPFAGLCQVNAVSGGRLVSLKGLPSGFKVSIGDFIRIGAADLHRVVEAITVGANGTTPQFELRPHLWPTAVVNAQVSLLRPYCLMSLVPGTLSSTADKSTGRGSVTFQGIEAR